MTSPTIADVDIKLLRVFCTIVECGGFSQAQTELNLSRSTISTHMANLETRLGFRLCRRGRAGFALTARGGAVYEASRAMLSSIDAYHGQIGQLRERIVGEIAIGVVDNLITNPECR
ncbi:MAG: LysR family transcriptional regulator, partial [Albidovulum sp.]